MFHGGTINIPIISKSEYSFTIDTMRINKSFDPNFYFKSITTINKGYEYLFCAIENTSRYAYVYPTKKESEQKECFIKFINYLASINKLPQYIISDASRQFTNKEVNDLLNKYNIIHKIYYGYVRRKNPYSNKNENIYLLQKQHPLSRIDRFIRTLRQKLYKFCTNDIWIDIIDDIVNTYNNTESKALLVSDIKNGEIVKSYYTPYQVYNSKELMDKVKLQILIKHNNEQLKLNTKFKPGVLVQKLILKPDLAKGSNLYSKDIYTIYKREGNSFYLQNNKTGIIEPEPVSYKRLKIYH